MEGIFQVLYDLAVYIYNFFATVPLSISLGSASLVTVIWLLSELTSLFLFWRAATITVWGFLAVSFFTPVGHLTSAELWAYLIIVVAASIIVSRLTKRRLTKRRKIKCPRCGTLVARA